MQDTHPNLAAVQDTKMPITKIQMTISITTTIIIITQGTHLNPVVMQDSIKILTEVRRRMLTQDIAETLIVKTSMVAHHHHQRRQTTKLRVQQTATTFPQRQQQPNSESFMCNQFHKISPKRKQSNQKNEKSIQFYHYQFVLIDDHD